MFVPPFRDPLNPNLDPAIIAGIGLIGGRAMFDLTRAGLTGISTGVTYDMWWNGGNRNVPVRHNIIGLLTEAASVDIASPLFLRRSELASPLGRPEYGPSNQFPAPWPGGWWRLRDINDYQFQFGKSLIGTLSREPATWLRNASEAASRALARGRGEGVRSWLIPSDNRDLDAVARLVDVLLRSGVEIERVTSEVMADGRRYPAGSLLIRRDQPYGAHVKDLFEIQDYPEGAPPYDVSGWTLPMLLGVRRVEVFSEIETSSEAVGSARDGVEGFSGDPRVTTSDQFSIADSGAWTRLTKRAAAGKTTYLTTEGSNAGIFVADYAESDHEDEGAQSVRVVRRLPRIGIYSPWSGNMDEGWMRFVFDRSEIPFVSVKNEQLRAGHLGDFLDVSVVAGVCQRQLDFGRPEGSVPAEFVGGLNPEGTVAIEEFVRGGGKLVTVGNSSQWAIDVFGLPLVDVTREAKGRAFSCPGSVVRCVPAKPDDTMLVGLPPSVPVFFSRSSAWRTDGAGKGRDDGIELRMTPLLNYGRAPVLLSGWIKQPDTIAGRHAWVQARYGRGKIQLFAFRPQYRGWSQAAFSLLFRSIYL